LTVVYLESDDIRLIHEIAISRYGGVPGEREPELVEYLAEKPSSVVFGRELFPGLFMKAAVYLVSIAQIHCFIDGNKRTAWGCASTFLELNGYELWADDDEVYQLCLDIANKRLDTEQVAAWIESHARPSRSKAKP